MTPAQFQVRWQQHQYNEQQGYQRHFQDLCALVGYEPPHDAGRFTFEKQVNKLGGGHGRADVWLNGHFGWEYKGPGADLVAAYVQLAEYREALGNPPLLVVSDLDRVEIHTNWPNTTHQVHRFATADIGEPATLRLLQALFTDPELLNPKLIREAISQQAARQVADVFDAMTGRGVDPHEAAHFLMRVVFSLFAEDVRLLPPKLVTDLLRRRVDDPERLDRQLGNLFEVMSREGGGDYGVHEIEWFNGGLFDGRGTVPLTSGEIRHLAAAADLDWSKVEPSIFGNLLEGALSHDPARRQRLGAHYTSRQDIEEIIEPVLMQPLRRAWLTLQARCDSLVGEPSGQATLRQALDEFKHRLGQVRVLDPACGSGNFLYVALVNLLDLEDEVHQAGLRWGEQPGLLREVGPQQLFGLDTDPYAVELASVTVWIGYLQWRYEHSGIGSERPLLATLSDNIRQQDAVLCADDTEPEWPAAEVIVGNPPFLGGKRLRAGLGDAYVDRLFALWTGRVPREADLCCYWFEKARAAIAAGRARRAGLLATNSIRQGPQMRPVLQRLQETGGIFMAWSDRDWRQDGAAVRVAMVGFDDGSETTRTLNGQAVTGINPDLTSGVDVSQARRLRANAGIAFMGDTKGGAFDIPGDLARAMLAARNPDGRPNSDVVVPWFNGLDLTRRPRDIWIIDFGCTMGEHEAALYEQPFEYVREHVRPERLKNNRASYRERWWLHVEPRPAMRAALRGLPRYLLTCRVAKHRLFTWAEVSVLPDSATIAVACDDDHCSGVLQSRPHELWSLALASALEDRPRYTPTTCFETFPFPRPDGTQREAIAAAARRLDELRTGALANDPRLTLTALYNKRPAWLEHAHTALDTAVLAAYGWPADLPEHELLARLLALNLERAAAEAAQSTAPTAP
ncbi:MAG: class I SAM-dependent DNA methyltransferase [Fimbriimonadaceae bacterium]|nr:class I SAM-dependent DNA methyltransferase [Fimbriimonadaceae bacterium]